MTGQYSKNCEIEPVTPQGISEGMEQTFRAAIIELMNASVEHMSEHLASSYERQYEVEMDRGELKKVARLKCVEIAREVLKNLEKDGVKQ